MSIQGFYYKEVFYRGYKWDITLDLNEAYPIVRVMSGNANDHLQFDTKTSARRFYNSNWRSLADRAVRIHM